MGLYRENIYLTEAIKNKEVSVNSVVEDMKKTLNICKLSQFRSADMCSKFYGQFFLQSLDDGVSPSLEDWGAIYAKLFSVPAFCDNMAKFMVMWQPMVYTGMFVSLGNQTVAELTNIKRNRIRFLSIQKAMITMLHMKMDSIANMIKTQAVPNPEVTKFITTVDQSLSRIEFDINILIQNEIKAAVENEPLVIEHRSFEALPMSEEAQDLVATLENGQQWIQDKVNEAMKYYVPSLTENVFGDAADKVKATALAVQKASDEFERQVMKKVKYLRERRRNAKHNEMVGEALRINREIRRLLLSGAVGILNPMAGVITFVVSLCIDKKADARDRQIILDQIKDELEIVEEKIAVADRNGDEKAKIELIRFRQKLQHEYERVLDVIKNSKKGKNRSNWKEEEES